MSNEIGLNPTIWNVGMPFAAFIAYLLVGEFAVGALINGTSGMLFGYILCAALAFAYTRLAHDSKLESGALMGLGASAAFLLVNAIGLFGAVQPLSLVWQFVANLILYGVVFAGFLAMPKNVLSAAIAGTSYALATYAGWMYLGTATLFPPQFFAYNFVVQNAITGACLGAAAAEVGGRMKKSGAVSVPIAFAAFGLLIYVLTIGEGMGLLLTLDKAYGLLGALNAFMFAGPLKEKLIAAAISFALLFVAERVRKTTAS
ncbi:hypothetical protein COU36_02025 [Candidatus Micrarchaeota archaeon CG10_big_fil_rev_8_21_14_0_10_59_7]|nr:MAG: hypothetical protein COU36_02025 [Candidatus Micrarchaeota archaeon CG10_big_fil_rev_8_21_14_0_10_59_7]